MRRQSFSKEKRLKSNTQFKYVIDYGCCTRNEMLTLYAAKNEYGFSRLGVSIGRSYGNAVDRNRFKRLIREVFRLNQYQIPNGYDYLIIAKKKKLDSAFEQVNRSFLSLVSLVQKKLRQD